MNDVRRWIAGKWFLGWALTLSSVNQAAPVNPTGIFALTIIVIVSSGLRRDHMGIWEDEMRIRMAGEVNCEELY